MLEYMEKSSKSACTSAVDVAGHPCEYCTAKGASTLCLNPEQAKAAKQDLNYKCARKEAAIAMKDPYDPTCALAYLADPTEAACVQSNDADGKSCEYCTLQGLNLCLNSEQADIGIGIGIDCDDSNKSSLVADPLDTSCMSAFWTDQSEEVCVAAVDQDGKPCQYCSLPDSIVLCLTSDQAAIGQALGMDCTTDFGLVLPALAMAVKP
jgi:hypothetical protein